MCEENEGTAQRYFALMSFIQSIENRMKWAELFYLGFNMAILLFTANYVSALLKNFTSISGIELALALFCLVAGMAICTYWVASALRQQLKLKLHYFQARFLERKMNCTGECIFSDESIFFDPDVHRMESPDGKETLHYPTRGLTRLDGFIGTAKPRHFTYLLPLLFFLMYLYAFVYLLAAAV